MEKLNPASAQRGRVRWWLSATAAITILLGVFVVWRAVQSEPSSPALGDQRDSPDERTAQSPAATTIAGDLVRRREQAHQRALDPTLDGWTSEVMASTLHARVQRLVDSLKNPASIVKRDVEPLLSSEFFCGSLRPPVSEAFSDRGIRFLMADGENRSNASRFGGSSGWAAATLAFQREIRASIERSHVKTVAVHISGNTAHTIHQIELLARSSSTHMEYHFQWHCEWELAPANVPLLRSLQTRRYRETISTAKSPFFRDHTHAVVGSTHSFRAQLRHGLNHWLTRVPTTHGMYLFAEYGVAVGDANGDGLDDVYICQPGGLPNRLLLRDSDGTLFDDSAAGLDWLDHSSSALFVDLDNDHDQDLLIATENRRVLAMRNDATGKFRLAAELIIEDRHVQGLSAADYDNDGDLDVYLTVGFADETARASEHPPSFVYHDANEGGANALFRNDIGRDGWQFTNVTKTVGLDHNNRRHSLAAAWEDFDDDGDQDLYVANDYGQNCLYENDGKKFRDIATTAGVVDYGSGMSVSWSDFDLDGKMDLYVGNMFSSAGSRITRQPGFLHSRDDDTRRLLQRFAKGNTLFHNLGTGRFEDVGRRMEVQMGRWSWSSIFTDINNDGLDDLLVVNGYITNDDANDL